MIASHPMIRELLESTRLEDNILVWPSDSYHQWLDRMSHMPAKDAGSLAQEVLALAYRIRREIPEGREDVITKLYTCANLLQQRANEQATAAKETATRGSGSANSPGNNGTGLYEKNDQAVPTAEPSLLAWFEQRHVTGADQPAINKQYENLNGLTDDSDTGTDKDPTPPEGVEGQ